MAKRERISAPDIIEHPQPFPTAVKVGNVVFSSALGGHDPQSHEMPEDIESQVANAFQTARRIMEEAGGSTSDIGKIVVYMSDRENRKFVNPVWTEMFPDEDDRPVRHTVPADLPPGYLIQIEFIAVI
ncbi:MAG: RidA family protein [Rhodospirillales bacterium]|nr:RidA family protein [Rhodospirillales bacterium]